MQANDVRLKRVQWRCRRGTRELDALLQGWLAARGTSLDAGQLAALDGLLDQQDPDLWDWLMGHSEAPRSEWQALIRAIRQHAGLTP
ncbi:MAG TPA: succinate dehydrogenase assembly factor 2 [Rhodanobacteraceae bacterium]|nr:succinate dehydrogenase assembly factor 2 [Rhodanobacteraceae bacterium]